MFYRTSLMFSLIVYTANAILMNGEIEHCFLYFVYGSKPSERQAYKLDNATAIRHHPHFNPSKPTAMYIHGFMQSLENEDTETLIDAYLYCDRFNILIFDWGVVANSINYFMTAIKVVPMGRVLVKMFTTFLSISDFHLIGHSLGSVMTGIIGNTIQECSDFKLPRITGLDPAGPLYFRLFGVVPLFLRQLSPSDADFVDIIHSDSGFLGYGHDMGTVDFYPNGGTRFQPGCSFVTSFFTVKEQACSHERSVEFFSQSLRTNDPTAFEAMRAASWADFQRGQLINESADGRVVQMGINCPKDISGRWYLQTSAERPYTLGAEGTHFRYRDNILRDIVNRASYVIASVLGFVLY